MKSTGYFTTKLETKIKGERGEQQPCQGIPKTHLCCLLTHEFPMESLRFTLAIDPAEGHHQAPLHPTSLLTQTTFLITILMIPI